MPPPEHNLTTGRYQLGKSPIGRRPVYGTSGRCSCGWKVRINLAPSQGGNTEARQAHRAHVDAVD